MNTNIDSAYQSDSEDNFATFSPGLDFLNQAVKEQNTPSRFASLFESQMDQILKEKHFNKTKQMTNLNWSISTFKGKLNFFRFKLLNIYLQWFLEIVKLTEKLSAKVINTFKIKLTSNYRCSDNSLPVWFSFVKITFKWFLF